MTWAEFVRGPTTVAAGSAGGEARPQPPSPPACLLESAAWVGTLAAGAPALTLPFYRGEGGGGRGQDGKRSGGGRSRSRELPRVPRCWDAVAGVTTASAAVRAMAPDHPALRSVELLMLQVSGRRARASAAGG